MSLQNKKYIRKLSKKSKNKKSKKYERKKKTSFLSSKRDSLNQLENHEKILFITIKLLKSKKENKKQKNEL